MKQKSGEAAKKIIPREHWLFRQITSLLSFLGARM